MANTGIDSLVGVYGSRRVIQTGGVVFQHFLISRCGGVCGC